MHVLNLTRRRLLLGAGVAIAGTILPWDRAVFDSRSAAAASVPPHDQVPTLAGTITRIDPVGRIVLRNVDGTRIVTFSVATTFVRARVGPVAGAGNFMIGEEVVAEGRYSTDSFVATRLVTMYRALNARVVQQRGDHVQTSAGTIRLFPDTLALDHERFTGKPLPQLTSGEGISGLTWLDPATGDLAAFMIGPEGRP